MLTNRDQSILNFLIRQAISVDPVNSSKIAAAIVIKNQIISTGSCKFKTHPFQTKFGKNKDSIYLHAEIEAIKNALNCMHPDDLKYATLYVQRVKRPGQHHNDVWINGMAKPCCGCMRCISTFGIKKVIYSTETGYEIIK